MSQKILITGANRGLGLELVKQYLEQGAEVFAASRQNNPDTLTTLASHNPKLHVVQLDVSDPASYEQLIERLNTQQLDILINNAGIIGQRTHDITSLEATDIQKVIYTNAIAPVMLSKVLLPVLKQGSDKLIINITSRMGSIQDNTSGGHYAYRASKAALNAMMKSMQLDLNDQGFRVLLLHPGWVRTDMGGQEASLSAEESVAGMIKIITQAKKLPGLFYRFDGGELPW